MALSLATYNVKNLLRPRDDAGRRVSTAKVRAIAAQIAASGADVVGLQEIGDDDLLDAVREQLPGGPFAVVHGTRDARGIGCALLSRAPIVESRVHTTDALPFPVFQVGDPPPFDGRLPLRRGIVHACLEAPGLGRVDVLVAHFKSARPVPLRDMHGGELPPRSARARMDGAVRSLVWRLGEALYVRGLVDAVRASRPDARVAVVGDLNDTSESRVVRTLAGDGPDALRDCAAAAPEGRRYSCLHEGQPVQIDHILATPELHAHLRAAAFLVDGLRDHGAMTDAEEAAAADSDHAPLVVRFE